MRTNNRRKVPLSRLEVLVFARQAIKGYATMSPGQRAVAIRRHLGELGSTAPPTTQGR